MSRYTINRAIGSDRLNIAKIAGRLQKRRFVVIDPIGYRIVLRAFSSLVIWHSLEFDFQNHGEICEPVPAVAPDCIEALLQVFLVCAGYHREVAGFSVWKGFWKFVTSEHTQLGKFFGVQL